MKIITVSFDPDKTNFWSRMRKVFVHSVKQHMPGVEVIQHIIPAPAYEQGKAVNLTYNTEKLRIWNDYQQQSKEDTIFIDSDMLCLGDARPGFNGVKDIGITFNPQGTFPPLNAGVVFAKPTQDAKDFFYQWEYVNKMMYDDKDLHSIWKAKYLGMNQAALGFMIKSGYHSWIKDLDARIYNVTDPLWSRMTDDAVFVHLKGQLRTALLGNVKPQPPFAKVMQMWYDLDSEVNGEDHSEQVNKCAYHRGLSKR